MDYLKALGVNVIYLNPSFASISNHRYDTSDYSKLDPILGDLGDFEELVKAADENGMHIILDGVFNHVSDDSIYFDRYYKYLEGGADVNQERSAHILTGLMYMIMRKTMRALPGLTLKRRQRIISAKTMELLITAIPHGLMYLRLN